MRISRRNFLEVGSMVAAASAATAFPRVARAVDDEKIDSGPRRDVLSRLKFDDAKYLVGSFFTVQAHGKPVRFRCVSVTLVPEDASSSSLDPSFAIRFLPQSSVRLDQGTYSFEHPVLGQFQLFIVPSGPKTSPRSYTAIVNHTTS